MYTYTMQYCAQLCPTHCGPMAPLSMESSSQEYWNGLPLPTPGDCPNPGIKPTSLASALASRFFTTESPGKPKEKCRKIEISARDAES